LNVVSVVIPYFNRGRYLQACLDSVLGQTQPPAETIVVDDGSDPEERRSLQGLPPQIRVMHLFPNRGVAVARNAGWRAARGDLVAFQDSDDIWEPTKLETQVRYLAGNPDCSGVQTGVCAFRADGTESRWGDLQPRLTLAEALRRNCLRLQTLLIRTSVLQALDGFDESLRYCEDDDLGIRLAERGYRVDFLAEPLVRLRRERHGSLTQQSTRFAVTKIRVALKHRRLLERTLGRGATRRRVADALCGIGKSRGRLVGRAFWAVGRLLGGKGW